MELRDSVVLVTGAGRGIGRATALAFAREGAHVALMGKTKKNLLEVQKEVKALGVRALVLPGDVSDEGSVARCVSTTEQEFSAIDVLVNNAGLFATGPVDKMDTLVFDRVLAVNLRGPFLMMRAVIPGMKSRRRGHVLNISSTAGKRAFASGGAYAASKFGLTGLSQAALYEARSYDVKVTCIHPSTVLTDMITRSGLELKKPEAAILPEDIAEVLVDVVKLGSRAMVSTMEIWQTNP